MVEIKKFGNFLVRFVLHSRLSLLVYGFLQLVAPIFRCIGTDLMNSCPGTHGEKNSVRITISDAYENMPRDFLLILNQLASERKNVELVRKNDICRSENTGDPIHLYLSLKDEKIDTAELVSCTLLIDSQYSSHIGWDVFQDSMVDFYDSDHLSCSYQLGSDTGVAVPDGKIPWNRQAVQSPSCTNVLEIPFGYQIWAHNFQKMKPPWTKYISIEIRSGSGDSSLMRWWSFFSHIMNRYPEIHFILLDHTADLSDEPHFSLPNITTTKNQGFSLLQELSLVRRSDFFIGYFSVYSVMVLGTDIPYIIMDTDGNHEYGKKIDDLPSHIWLNPIIEPDLLFKIIEEKIQMYLYEDKII